MSGGADVMDSRGVAGDVMDACGVAGLVIWAREIDMIVRALRDTGSNITPATLNSTLGAAEMSGLFDLAQVPPARRDRSGKRL
jgi:hypothetical protein